MRLTRERGPTTERDMSDSKDPEKQEHRKITVWPQWLAACAGKSFSFFLFFLSFIRLYTTTILDNYFPYMYIIDSQFGSDREWPSERLGITVFGPTDISDI